MALPPPVLPADRSCPTVGWGEPQAASSPHLVTKLSLSSEFSHRSSDPRSRILMKPCLRQMLKGRGKGRRKRKGREGRREGERKEENGKERKKRAREKKESKKRERNEKRNKEKEEGHPMA